MQKHVVPVSRDGVVTIPDEVRERLDGGSRESVEFVIRDDGIIEIRPPQATLDGVFGPIPSIEKEEEADREVAMGQFMRLSNAEGFKRILH